MAQCVSVFVYNLEFLISNPQHPCKQLSVAEPSCNSSVGKHWLERRRESIAGTPWSSTKTENFRLSETLSRGNKAMEQDTQQVFIWPPHVLTHRSLHTHSTCTQLYTASNTYMCCSSPTQNKWIIQYAKIAEMIQKTDRVGQSSCQDSDHIPW